MIIHSRCLRSLCAAALLLGAALPAAAADQRPANCPTPAYPRSAVRQLEEGISMFGFLIRADGTVADSVVLNSSGSPTLDITAREAFLRCAFTPASVDGKPVARWVPVAYAWSFIDDPSMVRMKRQVALAAGKGNTGARYHLALIMKITAKTDADREQALIMLRSAAELGHPQAQFELATRLEKGEGIAADAEAALDWYRQSAAQGNVLAAQRLETGY